MTLATFTITYDGRNVDFAALPPASQAWLAREGFAHGYGNRVASKVVGQFRTQARQDWIKANGDEAWKALDKAAQSAIEKSGIPDTESPAYVEALAAGRAEFLADMEAGKLSEGRVAGPKQTPLEAECAAIARRETIEILTKQGLFVVSAKKRVPAKDDTFEIGKETLSFADLIERRLAKNTDRIEREAKAELARREKAVAKVAGEELAEAF